MILSSDLSDHLLYFSHHYTYYTLQIILDLWSTICQSADNYIFTSKFEQSSYLFSPKNSRPCRDLNPGPPRYQVNMLPIELSWLGSKNLFTNIYKLFFYKIRRLLTIPNQSNLKVCSSFKSHLFHCKMAYTSEMIIMFDWVTTRCRFSF